jgi:hypothetical protein
MTYDPFGVSYGRPGTGEKPKNPDVCLRQSGSSFGSLVYDLTESGPSRGAVSAWRAPFSLVF